LDDARDCLFAGGENMPDNCALGEVCFGYDGNFECMQAVEVIERSVCRADQSLTNDGCVPRRLR
jgi:hypothetical protein